MPNTDANTEKAAALAEVATRNSITAVITAEKTRDELLERIFKLEGDVATQANRIQMLEQKYNVMLGARFDGKATV